MPLPALIKVLSLGYLLSSVCLAVAALGWRLLRPRISPLYRADCGFTVYSGTFLLCLLLTAYIWFGVVQGVIKMTTHYFHRLMYGGWGLGITITGLGVLLISLLLAWRAWQRTRIPRTEQTRLGEAHGLPIHAAANVATIALVGVWRPQLWVNSEYWNSLTAEQREVALRHELMHQARRDNLKKTLLGFIGSLYYILPPLRRIQAEYDLDCELAVDGACNRSPDAQAYRELIVSAASFVVVRQQAVVSSGLGNAGLNQRLRHLERGYPRPSALHLLASHSTSALLVTASMLPGLALLTHPTPRCLLACYLGY